MKYSSSNKPLICMQTQSTCYKGTSKMTPRGILWHGTGANNPTLKRYIQPSDVKPAADTYSKEKWLEVLGVNKNKNDWNHIERQAGLNAWVGKLANGTVTSIQTMPWDFKPWGCGSGSKGSCNNGWMQFEICEDALTDKNYFTAAYKEACELTAYYCQLYNIDPKGTVTYNGVKVPTILCHQDAYKLGLGSNHSDVYNWFNKYGKTMDDVRNDVATLLKGSSSVDTSQPTTAGTYKVVTEINKYSSSSDAKSQKNSKGKMSAGTYYIFASYPNGYNGMYNLTTDKTGKSAGSWINPAENVVAEVKEEVQKVYRVRKSWTDSKSQVGAYSSLENAKEACQKAGPGYKVYDWNGKEVYAYVAPVVETKPVQSTQPETPVVTKPKEVYELDFPVKHRICDYRTMEEKDYKKYFTQCCEIILENNSTFDTNIVRTFFTLAPVYGVDAIRAISQSILETGWFKYQGSAVKPEHHNYCGLGVTVTGKPGNIFETIEDGVRAQLQHLFAYGSKEDLPTGETLIDQRFKYVTRGIAPTWEELAGRWAVPGFEGSDAQASIDAGTTYGQKIDKIYESIVNSIVSEESIKKYFNEAKPEVPTPEQPQTEVENEDVEINKEKINSILDILVKILKFITDLFKK